MPQPTFKQQLDFNHAKAILKAIKGNVNSKKVVSLLDTMFKDEKQILTAVKNVSSNSANFVKQALPDKTNPTFGGKILGVLNSMKDIVEKAIGTAWTKVTELSPTNKYIIAGLFGAFILFAIQKLIKWLTTPKQEEQTTEEFSDNFIMFRSKMIEGTDFLETLTQRIRESDEPVMGSNIIAKALPLADQASDFVLNEEQTEKKSFIKKYGYAILAGVACIASILVYWFYFKANPAAAVEPPVLPNGTGPGDVANARQVGTNQKFAGPGDVANSRLNTPGVSKIDWGNSLGGFGLSGSMKQYTK